MQASWNPTLRRLFIPPLRYGPCANPASVRPGWIVFLTTMMEVRGRRPSVVAKNYSIS